MGKDGISVLFHLQAFKIHVTSTVFMYTYLRTHVRRCNYFVCNFLFFFPSPSIVGFVIFVLTLKKEHYQTQFGMVML